MENHDTGQKTPGHERKAETIAIELTHGQIDRIIRETAGTSNLSALLADPERVQKTLLREPALLDNPGISRSLLTGLLLLATLPTDDSYTRIADLARVLSMSMSTTHRYLSTFVAAGLVERDPKSRQYRVMR